MKKGYIILITLLALISLLFFRLNYTGFAVKESEEFFCNPPYYEYAKGSCCLDEDYNGVCDIDEKTEIVEEEETIIEEPIKAVETPEETVEQNIFEMGVGDTVEFDNKKITVTNIDVVNLNVETTIDVNGMERIIFTTNYPEIINGLIIKVKRLNDPDTVTIEVEPLELGSNEHLIFAGKTIKLYGETIRLWDVFDDESVLVDIMGVDEGYKLRIRKGFDLEFHGLKITNIDAYPRPAKYERCAILKIEQI